MNKILSFFINNEEIIHWLIITGIVINILIWLAGIINIIRFFIDK